MKTNKWTKILVATGCCVFAMGAGFMNLTATAKAEDKTLGGVTVSSFAMDDGAWVRKDTTKETTGLRFVARTLEFLRFLRRLKAVIPLKKLAVLQ